MIQGDVSSSFFNREHDAMDLTNLLSRSVKHVKNLSYPWASTNRNSVSVRSRFGAACVMRLLYSLSWIFFSLFFLSKSPERRCAR